MQIVIEIDEEDKQYLDDCLKGKGLAFLDNAQLIKRILWSVFHGTPLPKGHGRLIDADEVEKLEERLCATECACCRLDGCFYDDAETIIEADRSEKE